MRLVITSKITKVSRCTNNAGIPVISLSKRSYGMALMIITVGINKFNLHFKPVQKDSDNVKIKAVCPRNFPNCKCNGNHPNHNKCEGMTPNKLQNLYRGIQSTLQFMNSSNLHHNQQFRLTGSGIAQILLKIYKLDGVIPTFSHYSSQNNNTIITQEFGIPISNSANLVDCA